MEFDKSRVYSVVNADKLKVGSKVIVANSIGDLKQSALNDEETETLTEIFDEYSRYRFEVNYGTVYALAYLVEEPVKLHWTDLEIGDIIVNGSKRSMVTTIDSSDDEYHIHTHEWLSDTELKDWKKVEK